MLVFLSVFLPVSSLSVEFFLPLFRVARLSLCRHATRGRLLVCLWRPRFLLNLGHQGFCAFITLCWMHRKVDFYLIQMKFLVTTRAKALLRALYPHRKWESHCAFIRANAQTVEIYQWALWILVGFAHWKTLAADRCKVKVLSDICPLLPLSKTKIWYLHNSIEPPPSHW